MKIGIIGSGNMGTGLGKIWAAKGHELIFSYSRSKEKLNTLAASLPNAKAGTPAEAAQDGHEHGLGPYQAVNHEIP